MVRFSGQFGSAYGCSRGFLSAHRRGRPAGEGEASSLQRWCLARSMPVCLWGGKRSELVCKKKRVCGSKCVSKRESNKKEVCKWVNNAPLPEKVGLIVCKRVHAQARTNRPAGVDFPNVRNIRRAQSFGFTADRPEREIDHFPNHHRRVHILFCGCFFFNFHSVCSNSGSVW